MKRIVSIVCMLSVSAVMCLANPVKGLLERIDEGASKKFIIEKVDADRDFFELDSRK